MLVLVLWMTVTNVDWVTISPGSDRCSGNWVETCWQRRKFSIKNIVKGIGVNLGKLMELYLRTMIPSVNRKSLTTFHLEFCLSFVGAKNCEMNESQNFSDKTGQTLQTTDQLD